MAEQRRVVTCSRETPWQKATHIRGTQVIHADAQEVGGQRDGWPGGDLVTIQCPHCGHQWEAELPQ